MLYSCPIYPNCLYIFNSTSSPNFSPSHLYPNLTILFFHSESRYSNIHNFPYAFPIAPDKLNVPPYLHLPHPYLQLHFLLLKYLPSLHLIKIVHFPNNPTNSLPETLEDIAKFLSITQEPLTPNPLLVAVVGGWEVGLGDGDRGPI